MNVGRLIEILQALPAELPVAVHASNHTTLFGGFEELRVALIDTYAGKGVCIGNMSRRRLNGSNYFLTEEVDGLPPIMEDWPRF